MIYLIGGAPRTGKTIMAKKLANTLGVSWISTDDLEQGAKQSVPEDRWTELYPKDVIREKTKSSNDIMYTQYSADEILNAYVTQSKATWKAISSLVKKNINADEDLIIEGFQIEPKLMDDLAKKFGVDNIRAVVLTKNNVDQIVETARQCKDSDDWLIKKTADPAIHYKIAEMLARYSDYLETEAEKFSIKTVDYKSDFESQINEAQEYLK